MTTIAIGTMLKTASRRAQEYVVHPRRAIMSRPRRPSPARGLPATVGLVTGRLAQPLGRAVVPVMINRVLARQIADGSLDFLHRRILSVRITDLGVEWRFTLAADSPRIIRARAEPEATIRGDSLALLQLAARRVDPDTLFFNRRLMVQGDTELGLQAKNLLDTIEDEDLPPPLARFLDHAGRVAERWS